MFRNRLHNLLALNAKKGAGLKAEGNIIYLYDTIAGSESDAQWWGGISAENFAKQLGGMSGDVTVRIDSPGGDVFGGRAIAQAIREYQGTVTCQIDGLAASAASYVAISGDSVVAAPGSFMMIHRAWTFGLGNCNDLRASADLLEKIDGTIADSYAAKAGQDAADWLALMTAETWFTAAEAADLGLVDAVLSETVKKTSNRWDLSAFASPPEALTAEPEPSPEPAPEPDGQEIEIAARRRRLMVDALIRTA